MERKGSSSPTAAEKMKAMLKMARLKKPVITTPIKRPSRSKK